MTDIVSREKRSEMMSRIKGKNTQPEIAVRKMIYKMGYRYRLHRKDLPGKPDIVFGPMNLALFVNGCFWHRHGNCKYAYTTKTRKNFWDRKFTDTIKRDVRNRIELERLGWQSAVIWECETLDQDILRKRIMKIINNERIT